MSYLLFTGWKFHFYSSARISSIWIICGPGFSACKRPSTSLSSAMPQWWKSTPSGTVIYLYPRDGRAFLWAFASRVPPVPRFCFRVPCSHVPAQHFFCVPRAPAFLFCVPLLPLQLTHKVLSGAQLLVKMRYMRGGGEASPVASWLVPNAALWGSYHIYIHHSPQKTLAYKLATPNSLLQSRHSKLATPHSLWPNPCARPGGRGRGDDSTAERSACLLCGGGGTEGGLPIQTFHIIYYIY